MIRDQLTMAIVHEAFIQYLEGRTSQPIDSEWQRFKTLLLTRMAKDNKKNG